MSWQPLWEDLFASRSWGLYPPEELIRFVAKNFYAANPRHSVRILEIGCGPGANVWYMAREGFSVHGIDGSPTAVSKAEDRLKKEGLTADFKVGDIVDLSKHYPDGQFHAVVDVACLQCNSLSAVHTIMKQVYDILIPGGCFFSIMLAAGSIGFGTGREIEPGTFDSIAEGPLVGMGVNHYFGLNEVKDVFSMFSRLSIEYSERSFHERTKIYKNWVVEAGK